MKSPEISNEFLIPEFDGTEILGHTPSTESSSENRTMENPIEKFCCDYLNDIGKLQELQLSLKKWVSSKFDKREISRADYDAFLDLTNKFSELTTKIETRTVTLNHLPPNLNKEQIYESLKSISDSINEIKSAISSAYSGMVQQSKINSGKERIARNLNRKQKQPKEEVPIFKPKELKGNEREANKNPRAEFQKSIPRNEDIVVKRSSIRGGGVFLKHESAKNSMKILESNLSRSENLNVSEDLRCDTPDSETSLNSTAIENKRRNKFQHNCGNISGKFDFCSTPHKRSDNISPRSESFQIQTLTPSKPTEDQDYVPNSPSGSAKHVALREDNIPVNEISAYQTNSCEGASSYTSLKKLKRSHINSRVDVFGIVVDVLQFQAEGKKKKMIRLKITDQNYPLHETFEILLFYNNEKPKIEKRWIVRLRNVKIESKDDVLNGRVFSSGCLICFPTGKTGRECPEFITSRKKPYNYPDEDKKIVKNLKSFLKSIKGWNVLTLSNCYYPDLDMKDSRDIKLKDIKENTIYFSLKCKIIDVKMFIEVNLTFLSVEDNTICVPATYQLPKNATSWAEIVRTEEVYCPNSSTINILVKNAKQASNFQHLVENMKSNNSVLITDIQAIMMSEDDNRGLMFVADMKLSKMLRIPEIALETSIQPQQESQENGDEACEYKDTQNSVTVSEFNNLLSLCRYDGMPQTMEEKLKPIQGKKRGNKRKKLLSIDGLRTNINSTNDFNDDTTQHENLVNDNESSNHETQGVLRSESEGVTNDANSNLQSNDVSCSSPGLFEKSVGLGRKLCVKIIPLRDDEISVWSSKSSVCSENDGETRTRKVGNTRELCSSILNEEGALSKDNSENSTSSTRKRRKKRSYPKEESCTVAPEADNYNLNNDTIVSDKSLLSRNFSRVEVDGTNIDNMSLEECSLIENCRIENNVSFFEEHIISKTNDSKSAKKIRRDSNIIMDESRCTDERDMTNSNEAAIDNIKQTKFSETNVSSSSISEDNNCIDNHQSCKDNSEENARNQLLVESSSSSHNIKEKNENYEVSRKNVESSPLNKHEGQESEDETCSNILKFIARSRIQTDSTADRIKRPLSSDEVNELKVDHSVEKNSTSTHFSPQTGDLAETNDVEDQSDGFIFRKPHSSPSSVVTDKYHFRRKRKVCSRKPIAPSLFEGLSKIPEDRALPLTIERWLENVDPNVHSDECVYEKDLPANQKSEVNKGSEVAEPEENDDIEEIIPKEDERHGEVMPESHNLGEYIENGEVSNSDECSHLISGNAFIVNMEPSIIDCPGDIISGYCEESCRNFFRYSNLKFNSNSKPICPGCDSEGKEIEVRLVFLFMMCLMLESYPNFSLNVVVHAKHACRFLGCTESQFTNDKCIRSKVVEKLKRYLHVDWSCSVTYRPLFPIQLLISTSIDEGIKTPYYLVNTCLPDASSNPPSFPQNFLKTVQDL